MDEHTTQAPSASTETPAGDAPPRAKQRRGFAAMSEEKRAHIAAMGGRASHAQGTGHEWTTETARAAGRKGGTASRGGRGKLCAETAVGARCTLNAGHAGPHVGSGTVAVGASR